MKMGSLNCSIPVKFGSLQYMHPCVGGISTTHVYLSFKNLYNKGLHKMHVIDWSLYYICILVKGRSLYHVYPNDRSMSIKCIPVIGGSLITYISDWTVSIK